MEKTEDTIARINHFLASEFEVDEASISPEADMRKVLDMDSLDFIDLVVVLEKNFSFKVNPEDFERFATFQDFYDYVLAKLKEKEAA
jgi:acyl carrier protein